MAKPCFYHPELTLDGGIIELLPREGAHAMQSRRLSLGSEVRLLNGCGLMADAVIYGMSKRKVLVEVLQTSQCPRPELELSLAVAMPKGDRQKTMVDTLTQLGVSRLIPMQTLRSVSQLKANHVDKLKRVSIEACKQSQNPWAMSISEPLSFQDVLRLDAAQGKFYADQAGLSWREVKSERGQVIVLIGPEGGFSSAEIDTLTSSSVRSLRLGQHILRTESAAIAAASLFQC